MMEPLPHRAQQEEEMIPSLSPQILELLTPPAATPSPSSSSSSLPRSPRAILESLLSIPPSSLPSLLSHLSTHSASLSFLLQLPLPLDVKNAESNSSFDSIFDSFVRLVDSLIHQLPTKVEMMDRNQSPHFPLTQHNSFPFISFQLIHYFFTSSSSSLLIFLVSHLSRHTLCDFLFFLIQHDCSLPSFFRWEERNSGILTTKNSNSNGIGEGQFQQPKWTTIETRLKCQQIMRCIWLAEWNLNLKGKEKVKIDSRVRSSNGIGIDTIVLQDSERKGDSRRVENEKEILNQLKMWDVDESIGALLRDYAHELISKCRNLMKLGSSGSDWKQYPAAPLIIFYLLIRTSTPTPTHKSDGIHSLSPIDDSYDSLSSSSSSSLPPSLSPFLFPYLSDLIPMCLTLLSDFHLPYKILGSRSLLFIFRILPSSLLQFHPFHRLVLKNLMETMTFKEQIELMKSTIPALIEGVIIMIPRRRRKRGGEEKEKREQEEEEKEEDEEEEAIEEEEEEIRLNLCRQFLNELEYFVLSPSVDHHSLLLIYLDSLFPLFVYLSTSLLPFLARIFPVLFSLSFSSSLSIRVLSLDLLSLIVFLLPNRIRDGHVGKIMESLVEGWWKGQKEVEKRKKEMRKWEKKREEERKQRKERGGKGKKEQRKTVKEQEIDEEEEEKEEMEMAKRLGWTKESIESLQGEWDQTNQKIVDLVQQLRFLGSDRVDEFLHSVCSAPEFEGFFHLAKIK